MQHPYTLRDLTPLSQWMDEDGDSHAVYQLPAPKRWNIRSYIGEDIPVELESEQLVTKVRVCLFANEDSGGIPSAIVVPFDEEGKESACSCISLPDTLSFQAVLHRLGFAPAPHLN